MSQRRKWFGVVLLLIEMNLLGGTIFGFPALFQILAKNKIYADSLQQIKHYQVNSKQIIEPMNIRSLLYLECNDIRNRFFRFTSFFYWIFH